MLDDLKDFAFIVLVLTVSVAVLAGSTMGGGIISGYLVSHRWLGALVGFGLAGYVIASIFRKV